MDATMFGRLEEERCPQHHLSLHSLPGIYFLSCCYLGEIRQPDWVPDHLLWELSR